tara:strand:+ start:368 stop:589 length:222 start_codon:yes stop_codon:yes gene_type:complete
MKLKRCPGCEATWIDGQLYWATGKEACPHDLAGLVCNVVNWPKCINPCKGSTSGMTWEHRQKWIEAFDLDINN